MSAIEFDGSDFGDSCSSHSIGMIGLEKDFRNYVQDNPDAEIEMTLKTLARKYQQVFDSRPVKALIKAERRKQEIEAIKQLEKKAKMYELRNRPMYVPVQASVRLRVHNGYTEPEYQDYLQSIRLASLLSDMFE